MPQLDPTWFPSQIFWLAISFIVLFVLMNSVGLPRVRGIIDERRGRVAGDLGKAAQMKEEAEAVIAAYERALAEARTDAQATLREAMERMNAEGAQRLKVLADSLAAETAAAERRITAAKDDALANLREVAVDVARAVAQRVAGSELDPARAREAVEAVMRERA